MVKASPTRSPYATKEEATAYITDHVTALDRNEWKEPMVPVGSRAELSRVLEVWGDMRLDPAFGKGPPHWVDAACATASGLLGHAGVAMALAYLRTHDVLGYGDLHESYVRHVVPESNTRMRTLLGAEYRVPCPALSQGRHVALEDAVDATVTGGGWEAPDWFEDCLRAAYRGMMDRPPKMVRIPAAVKATTPQEAMAVLAFRDRARREMPLEEVLGEPTPNNLESWALEAVVCSSLGLMTATICAVHAHHAFCRGRGGHLGTGLLGSAFAGAMRESRTRLFRAYGLTGLGEREVKEEGKSRSNHLEEMVDKWENDLGSGAVAESAEMGMGL